jgi:hypothetical protein
MVLIPLLGQKLQKEPEKVWRKYAFSIIPSVMPIKHPRQWPLIKNKQTISRRCTHVLAAKTTF